MRRSAAAVILAGTPLWLGMQPGASTPGRFAVSLRVIPIVADVGAPVKVRFSAYSLTARGRVLSDQWQFHVVAVSPTNTRTRITLRHVARGTWIGAVRLRTLGTWQIRIADWPGGSGPIVKVKVRKPAPPPTETTPSP